MKLVFIFEARAELIEIGDYIARDIPLRALSFVDELSSRCQELQTHPLSHPLVRRYEAAGVRRLVHGNYLVFYRVTADTVTVLHVLHGAMDYEAVLFSGNVP